MTGFGPFLDVTDNPSGRVAVALDGERVGGLQIVAAVLPVSFTDAPRSLETLLRVHTPACVLALGVGQGDTVRLERGADNRVRSEQPDADGRVWAGRDLMPGLPARLETGLPLASWAAELHTDELPVVASDDAGGYVCNATYYELLTRTSDVNPCLFVHIPRECGAHRVTALAALCRKLVARLTLPAGAPP